MHTTGTARAELLSPAEIEARLAEASIVYLPLGTLEFHGPHLPIGLDALTAHGVCLEAARRSGGVVLPPVYQGFGGDHARYPWSIMMPGGEGIAGHVLATLERLDALGVRRAVLFSGHCADEQLEMIDDLERRWSGLTGRALELTATSVDRCASTPIAPDHAGRFETTLLAGIDPGLVHLDRLPRGAAPDPDEDPYGESRFAPGHPLRGILGEDPRDADLAEGAALLERLGAWLADIAEHGGGAG